MLTLSRPKGLALVGLSLLAALALAAPSASAEETGPKVTLLTEAGPLEKGDPIVFYSGNLVFSQSWGNEECSKNTLTAEDKTNTKEKPLAIVSAYTMKGEEVGGLCKTTTPLGPDDIEATNLPWKLKFTNTGVAEITSGEGTKTIRLVHTYPQAGGAKCIYSSKKVVGEFNTPVTPMPIQLSLVNQVFKLEAGSTNGCPAEGKYNGTFSGTGPGGATLLVEVK